MTDPITRIAEALERLAPPRPEPADPTAHPAYVWRGGLLTTAREFAPLPLAMLRGVERQRDTLLANMERLAAGHAAQDVLLWGARGTGKSALVKSAVAAVQAEGGALALVEAATADLEGLPDLFALLAPVERHFAVFIDDLGFDAASDARALRSLLEGGAEARPGNTRLFVTSNRRHLIPRDIAEQESAINPRDSIDDNLALADRFGLSLGFHAVDQDTYLAIIRGYAEAHGLTVEDADAVQWATRRGSRSGRVAWQYVVELAGRTGKSLDI
ncbi:ATP-binding protein [Stakelama tenebrarum]|uniref:ATP-binding protein n=1 Tax=Stakelama tenebrarum TaxID=2711215 RepID=A0A6G6Y957_9SPHN|nr:ATP-binding protein [Sphingosinithalassobacter tenebrarum]QIG81465.1 ATP-binding protein [Sphingosinithalassobacter tenebrarum]